MHASSLENMALCFERYIDEAFVGSRPGDACSVLDIGGADVNGTYRDLLDKRFSYVAADIDEAPGVTLLLDDPYSIPLPDASVDVVLSGQMLEHCEYFWRQFREMVRVLRPDGYLFLIAPSSGPIHRYPVDCYRFHPDAYEALARFAQCPLIDVWHDDRGPWCDVVGVFRPAGAPMPSPSLPAVSRRTTQPPSVRVERGDPAHEQVAGRLAYLDVLQQVHHHLAPRQYLEIGVRRGASLRLARCHAVGVDPAPEPDGDLRPGIEVAAMTSDEFFEAGAPGIEGEVDLAFIDGMHLAEYALRDFMNVERHMAHTGVVILDDVLPAHPMQARRQRTTAAWTGDVYKTLECLARLRQDLLILLLDTSPSGMAVIARVDPASDVLRSHYNALVRDMWDDRPVPEGILRREGAVDDLAVLRMLLVLLRTLRRGGRAPAEVRRAVDDLQLTAGRTTGRGT